MTVKECYTMVEGNYDEAVERFMDEARVKKYLLKFLGSKSFDELCEAMEAHDYEKAFMAVHSMKGISANIAFTKLNNLTILLTEELRGGNCTDKAWEYLDGIKANYETIKDAIGQLE